MKTKNEVNNYEPNVAKDVTPKDKKGINKTQKLIIAIISVILVICLIIGGWYLYERNVNKWDVKQNEITIEYGETYEPKLEDLVDTNTFKNVTNDNTTIEFATGFEVNLKNEEQMAYVPKGKYDISVNHKIEYKLFGLTLFSLNDKKIVNLNVVDTKAPIFTEKEGINPKEIEFVKDCKEEVIGKYVATDLSKVEMNFDDTNVNYSEVGEYAATVFATDESGNVTPLEVKVKIVAPTIELNVTTLTVTVDDSYTLEAKAKGKSQDIEWSSSDESIAKVENGKVTGIKAGTVSIKAKANDVEAICEVTVKVKPVAQTNNNSSSKNNKPSSSGNSNIKPSGNGASSNNNSGGNSSSSTGSTSKPVWCWEGGSKHVTPMGLGWYSSYNEAKKAGLAYIGNSGSSGSWEVQECDCGKFTVYVTID